MKRVGFASSPNRGSHPPISSEARSWSELGELLFERAWNPSLKRHRSTNAFRGVALADRPFVTGVERLGGDVARKERHLLRNFRKYARRSFVGDESPWNWLALAVHHGLPTRLLDWTYSPYVALHFVTAELTRFGAAGEVWAVDFAAAHRLLPQVLRDLLAEEGSDVFTGELLSRAAVSLEELETLAEDPFVVFLEPPSLDDRIVNQAALFSLVSRLGPGMKEWLDAHPELCRRIVIPPELKWEVRDKLDQANFTERVLFPGLDGLGAWLRRYYTERE